jgi:hypothetical protein
MSALALKKTETQPAHESYWFYVLDEVSHGPFSQNDIQKLIKDSKIGADVFCWRQGFQEWRPLSATQEFHDCFDVKKLSTYYPKLDVPSKMELRVVHALQKKEEQSQRKKVVVQLAKAKMYYFSIYEWGAALLFALSLAFFSCVFVLNEVKENFFTHLLQDSMGETREIGLMEKPTSLTPYQLQALVSAPGATEHNLPIAVSWEAFPSKSDDEDHFTHLDNLKVKSLEPVKIEQEYMHNLDGIYRYPVQVYGEILLKDSSQVLVKNPGSPLIFSH